MMSKNLLNRILREAKEIGVVRFKLMGGEVLLYPEWESIIKKAVSFGYQPDISTKKPMSEKELVKWKCIKNNSDPIQISLDTMIKSNLYKILHVKDPYYEQIIDTFSLLEKHHIDYVVHSVINKFNDSIEDIQSLALFSKGKSI